MEIIFASYTSNFEVLCSTFQGVEERLWHHIYHSPNGNRLCSFVLLPFHCLLLQQLCRLKIRSIQYRTNAGIQFLLQLLGVASRIIRTK